MTEKFMDRDDRRFLLVLLGVVTVLIASGLARSHVLGRESTEFDGLLLRGALQAEFQQVLGPPDRKTVEDGEECWQYEFDSNPHKMACFSLETGEITNSGFFWID